MDCQFIVSYSVCVVSKADGSHSISMSPAGHDVSQDDPNAALLNMKRCNNAHRFIQLLIVGRDFRLTCCTEAVLKLGSGAPMNNIVTSDDFVAGVFAMLALRGQKQFQMSDTELDSRFEKAFEDLMAHESELRLTPNFTFFVDKLHGDSVSLRDAVLSARDRDIVELKNPTFKRINILLDERRARRYLDRNPLPATFLEKIVSKHFSNI
jgi:hypothetical protein